jgi:hypothetical protein
VPPPTTSPLPASTAACQQASSLGEHRQLFDRCEKPLAVERGKVPGFTQLRVGEGGEDPIDVVDGREPEDDLACTDSVRRDR